MDRLLRWVVDKLRNQSRILEPEQRINPYRDWGARISDFEKALAELPELTDREEIARRVEKLLAEGAKGAELRARVVRAGLEAAPRVGEDFARKMLDQAIPAYDALPEAKESSSAAGDPWLNHLLIEQAALLNKALFVAARFGWTADARGLVSRFQQMVHRHKTPRLAWVFDDLAGQCFRGLRKLGMRDEIDQLLRQMADLVLEGQDVKAKDFKKEAHGPAALRTLLKVAAGWYYFGRDSQAEPVLQVARTTLMQADLPAREQTDLTCAYAAALGQAPAEVARPRLEEIFRQVRGVRDTSAASSHYSLAHLGVVEAAVLAAVEALTREPVQ